MNSNPLLDRMMKNELKKGKADFLHSSAYARAQSGSAIGAASAEGFERRKEIERNRTAVRGYRDSMVAGKRFGPREGAGDGFGPRAAMGGAERKMTNLQQAAEVRAQRSARFAPKRPKI